MICCLLTPLPLSSGFYYVKQGDEDALKTVIGMKGPVAIAINAGQRDFQFYNG